MFEPERVPDSTVTERADFLARDWEQRLIRARDGGRDRANYRSDEAHRDGLLLQPLLRGDLHTWEYFRPPLIENSRLVAAVDGIRASYGYLGGRIDGLSLNRLMYERGRALGVRHPQFVRGAAIVTGIVCLLGALVFYVTIRQALAVRAYYASLEQQPYAPRRFDSSFSAYADAPPPGFRKIAETGSSETWSSDTNLTDMTLTQTLETVPAPRVPAGAAATMVVKQKTCSNGPYDDYYYDLRDARGKIEMRSESVHIPWKRGETLVMDDHIFGSDAANPTRLEAPARFADAMCEHAR